MARNARFGVRSDVIILGTGLSGLVTGAVLAKSGRKVVVLSDESDGTGNRADLSYIPQALCVGFDRESPLDRIFSELGISISLLRRGQDLFRRSPVILQVVMPDFRFAFYHDRNDTLENFKAGFGKNVSRIKIFLDELDRWKPVLYPFLFLSEFPLLTKENWFAQLTAWLRYRAKIFKLTVRKGSEYCRSAGLDEKEMELFNALSIFSAGKTLDQVSALEFLQVLLLLTREPLVSVKGIPGLRDLFLKIIRENKGEVLGIRPAGLNFQDGQIGGVEFQGREGIGCDRLIWNPESGGWPAEEGKRVFQFYFELDERIIAPAMSDFLVLKRGAESLSDSRNFICFALSERRVPEKGEENGSSGKRGLVAQVIADTGGRMEDQETLSRLVEERITWLLPFAEKHLKLCSSRAVQTEARVPSYFPPEAGKKAASIPKSPGPTVSLGRHFHYFPHPVAEHFVSPFLIKRGYDLAVRIKTGS